MSPLLRTVHLAALAVYLVSTIWLLLMLPGIARLADITVAHNCHCQQHQQQSDPGGQTPVVAETPGRTLARVGLGPEP